METKEIILPDGWEVKEVQGNKIIIGEEDKKGLPKTWKECMYILDEGEYILEYGGIEPILIGKDEISEGCINILPEGLGKPMLALCQLLVCRNAWWKQLGWKPDWEDHKSDKYCIFYGRGKVDKDFERITSRVLAFPTPETRDQFLESFRDLIEEAKELL